MLIEPSLRPNVSWDVYLQNPNTNTEYDWIYLQMNDDYYYDDDDMSSNYQHNR